MNAKSVRTTNLNMRTTPQEKSFLQNAAELAGFSNLTNFIMTAARKEAIRILSDTNTTYLSANDWDQVSKLITNPPEPNQKLKDLLSRKE